MTRDFNRSAPTSAEQAKASYPDIRDRFIANSDEGEYSEWLVTVGRYVHDRWLAEESRRAAGQPLDEDASKHLWDECTEKYLRDMQVSAVVELQNYRRRHLVSTVADVFLRDGARVPILALWWTLKTMLAGFVGGFGLIFLGLIVVWLAPSFAKDVRGALDDAMPAQTSPYHGASCPAGATHQTDPIHC